MKSILLGLVLLISPLTMAASHASDDWRDLDTILNATLDIDLTGHVTHVQLDDHKVDPTLQALAEQNSHDWMFIPATLNGIPFSARTYARLQLQGRTEGDGQALRLRYLDHGPRVIKIAHPWFPLTMRFQQREAVVALTAIVQLDGSLSDIEVVAARVTDGAEGKAFYKSAIRALKSSRMKPEMVDGYPVRTTVKLALAFALDGATNGLLRKPNMLPASDAPKPTSEDNGELNTARVVVIDSPLKFRGAP